MLLTLKIALGVFLGLMGSAVTSVALLNSKNYTKLMFKITEKYVKNLESSYDK